MWKCTGIGLVYVYDSLTDTIQKSRAMDPWMRVTAQHTKFNVLISWLNLIVIPFYSKQISAETEREKVLAWFLLCCAGLEIKGCQTQRCKMAAVDTMEISIMARVASAPIKAIIMCKLCWPFGRSFVRCMLQTREKEREFQFARKHINYLPFQTNKFHHNFQPITSVVLNTVKMVCHCKRMWHKVVYVIFGTKISVKNLLNFLTQKYEHTLRLTCCSFSTLNNAWSTPYFTYQVDLHKILNILLDYISFVGCSNILLTTAKLR